jgi:fatty-acyl-CoA synthase
MEITQTVNGKKTILGLSGRFDIQASPEFRDVVSEIPDDTDLVIVDFRDVLYISSSGLRELLICRKRFRGERMEVINVSPGVYEIFESTGFDTLIPIKNTFCEIKEQPDYGITDYTDHSISSFLEHKVKISPDKTAIVYAGVPYSWMDIDKGADIIASDLFLLGVKKGSHVALCGINSINWVMTFYAIQKLGAIALLINPSQLASEIGKTAKVGDAYYICYGEMVEMKDEDAFVREISEASDCPLDRFYSVRNSHDIRERIRINDALKYEAGDCMEPDDVALMIFTSGSTGRPKGVLISSYNLMYASAGSCKDQTLTEEDRMCLILPLFHIFGLVAGLFASALAGSTVYIPANIRTDTIMETVSRYRCTVFHSVPTMLIAIMNNKNFESRKMETIRATIISGASASESQIEMFKKALPGDHFFSSYGLSEMAPVSITQYIDTDQHVLHTVGRPVEGIRIVIRDILNGEDCATSEKGEICVQGDNLMTGYYKLPIDDQSIDGEGWLHTGDIGYMDEDGYLCLVGRIKEIIIRGGENIMPGEVEEAVSSLDEVEAVKVLGIPSVFFGEEVCACITLRKGAEFDMDEAKRRLASRLARFKIPSIFEIYDSFPVLGTGKIDVVALKNDVLSRYTKEGTPFRK